jgi:hypothetical protein
MRNSTEIPQKIKNRDTACLSNLPFGIYSKEMKSVCPRVFCTAMFIVALLTIAKNGNNLSV